MGKTNSGNSEPGIRSSELKDDGKSGSGNRSMTPDGGVADGGSSAGATGSADAKAKTGSGKSVKRDTGEKGPETVEPETESSSAGQDDAIPESGIPSSECKKELAAERDRYLRLAAEYDNFRKRSAKEREKIYNDARTDTIIRLLPVYDNLERALKMECADEAFFKGVEMTMTQLTGILENMDVHPMSAIGESFDPNRHNAVMVIENPDLGEKIVAEEFQKGFVLGERVIRHSTVVVAN